MRASVSRSGMGLPGASAAGCPCLAHAAQQRRAQRWNTEKCTTGRPAIPLRPGEVQAVDDVGRNPCRALTAGPGEAATRWGSGQTAAGNRVEWQTAAVGAEKKGPSVTFVFAGGLGWVDQPKTPAFALLLDGKEVLRFDATQDPAKWKSSDGALRLAFVPLRRLPLDGVGLFCLTVPRSRLTPGKPVRLAVVSLGKASRRWFGLNPYKNVAGRQ